jgi:hypothetical protein
VAGGIQVCERDAMSLEKVLRRRRSTDDDAVAALRERTREEGGAGDDQGANVETDWVLSLQRSLGNAAVSRLLQREAAAAPATPWVFNPLKPAQPDFTKSGPIFLPDHTAAVKAVEACVDSILAQSTDGNPPFQSVAEIVALARARTWRTAEGKEGTVADKISAAEVETMVRDRARARGVPLLDHRKMSDRAGVEAEAKARLANMGVEGKATFGSEQGKIVIDMAGEVSAEVKAGNVKVEGELAKDEAKAEVKAGTMLALKGAIKKDDHGEWKTWRVQLSFGTLGNVITPAEIAEVMKETQKTFEKGTRALQQGAGQALLDQHGAEMRKAVEEVLEKARKSAEQRGGWSISAGAERKETGETVASVTFTWTF